MSTKRSKSRPSEGGQQPKMLQYLTAAGSIATPILLLLLSGVGWLAREEIQRQNKVEEKLREDRIETYNTILEPFVFFLMTDAAWESDPANAGREREQVASRLLLSTEYRRQGFKLTLLGSDETVQAYNNLRQYSFHIDPERPSSAVGRDLTQLIGALLLEIRRDMGNDTTQLDRWGMLEWFVSDARKYRLQGDGR